MRLFSSAVTAPRGGDPSFPSFGAGTPPSRRAPEPERLERLGRLPVGVSDGAGGIAGGYRGRYIRTAGLLAVGLKEKDWVSRFGSYQ